MDILNTCITVCVPAEICGDPAGQKSVRDGNAIVTGDAVCLESLTQEMSGCGRGDVGDPFVRVVHSDGSSTCDFLYESHEIKSGRDVISGLPSADGAVDEMTQLTVTLRDVASGLCLILSMSHLTDVM